MVSTDQRARNFFVPVYISWTVYTKANYPFPAALAVRLRHACGAQEAFPLLMLVVCSQQTGSNGPC